MKIALLTSMALVLAVAGCGSDGDQDATSGTSHSPSGTGGAGPGGGGGDGGGHGGSGGSPIACGAELAPKSLEGGAWDARFTIAGFTDHDGIAPRVNDFALEPDGSLLATGRFRYFEGQDVTPLMRWKNGAWSAARTTWELPLPSDGFQAIAVGDGGDLALATAASSFPGSDKKGEIWLDGGSGLEVIGAFDGQVRTLAWFDGELWAAGLFSLTSGGTAENLAIWDGTGWSAPPGGGADGPVYDLFVDGDTIFAAGTFTSVGGTAAANVASWDGAAWKPYDFASALLVFTVARTAGGALYVGGALTDFDTAGGLARWDGTAFQIVGGGLGQFQTRGVVSDLVVHGEVVDVAGCFASAGGLAGAPGAVTSRSFARWDGAAWQSLDDGTHGVLDPWFSPGVCGDEDPTALWDVDRQRLVYDGARLVAGGMMPGAGGVLSQSIVAYDGSWKAQGKSGLGIGGSIDRFAVSSSCDVYALGTFSHVAGAPAAGRVLHFDGSRWQTLATTLPADAYCPALETGPAGEVVMGCIGSDSKGAPIGQIFAKKGDAMVDEQIDGLGPVLAAAFSPTGALWISGSTPEGKGYLARVDGDKPTIVADSFDGPLNQLDVAGDDDVVVGGAFTSAGATKLQNVARWDGKSWSALGKGVPGQVTALGRDGESVYVSTYDAGDGAYLLGAFDGKAWRELASHAAGLTAKPEFNFNRIRAIRGALLVAGSAELDDGSARGALVYKDGHFEALAGGVGAIGLSDVTATNDAIWVAGSIAQAGDEKAPVSTVGVARYGLR